MMKLKLQQFAEAAGGDPGAVGENSPGGDGATNPAETNPAGAENGGSENGSENIDALNAEIARLKAEMAKQKKSLDEATSEAGKYRRELKSKMTQEQIDAEEKAEAAQKTAQELEALRKEVAKGRTVKTVMGKLGLDEDAAGSLADHLYGAADIENAMLEIQKAWQAREKALRMEFGKIPPPGAGGNSPEEQKKAEAIARARNLGSAQSKANEAAQKAVNAYMR